MAIRADNPRIRKGLKRKGRKVEKDGFAKKEKFILRVNGFKKREVGITLLAKQSTVTSTEKGLIGRCFIVNQGDLNENEDSNYRTFEFKITSLDGTVANARFNGMALTSEKSQGMVRRGHTLIEAIRDVVTSDGYTLRVVCVAQTKRDPKSAKKHCYAKTSTVKKTRAEMFKVIEEELNGKDLETVVKKLTLEAVGNRIEKNCYEILPLQNSHVLKVKVVKAPITEE